MVMNFKTRAAFHLGGKWHWVVWTHKLANKHEVILRKANELKADAWDFSNADHEFTDRAGF